MFEYVWCILDSYGRFINIDINKMVSMVKSVPRRFRIPLFSLDMFELFGFHGAFRHLRHHLCHLNHLHPLRAQCLADFRTQYWIHSFSGHHQHYSALLFCTRMWPCRKFQWLMIFFGGCLLIGLFGWNFYDSAYAFLFKVIFYMSYIICLIYSSIMFHLT